MLINNPYYYHPQPATLLAADVVFSYISADAQRKEMFEQGKMLGVLIVENDSLDRSCFEGDNPSRVHYINKLCFLAAYSGVVNGYEDIDGFFVPPIYDLQKPDDFYLTKDAEISALNKEISEREALNQDVKLLKQQRQQLSLSLQREIFSHFNFVDAGGVHYRNIIDIFTEAKRGLPPGGAGECAAPRLLQYALQHGLKPLYLAEFWYGQSPKRYHRIHGHYYPSCIEKCSPILTYQIGHNAPEPRPYVSDTNLLPVLFEDEYLLVVSKPADLLSVPSKNLDEQNVETLLHKMYPMVKGPMLVHRLDQATSGILIAAKDATTHKTMQQYFLSHAIQKRYVATLKGCLQSDCGIVSLPLTVNPDDRPRQVYDPQFGKSAVTYFEVVKRTKSTTLVHLYPLTGRTHQLRVHCASPFGLDHPIVGDVLYDILDVEPRQASRLHLHAEQVVFTHPYTNKEIVIDNPLLF